MPLRTEKRKGCPAEVKLDTPNGDGHQVGGFLAKLKGLTVEQIRAHL